MTIRIGKMHVASFETDPKHLGFVLARYHFVARMLHGRGLVLEVGCGDCTGMQVVKGVVGALIGCDLDVGDRAPIYCYKHDILDGPFHGPGGNPSLKWDAVYSLDVLEHISPDNENLFLRNICESLSENGAVIIGMPSLESQPYASELSKLHHVNCKTENELRELLSRHFYNVFLFGMNDSSLHTGYGPMCHYRLAVCSGSR